MAVGLRTPFLTSGPVQCLSHFGALIMVSSKVMFENRQHPLQDLGYLLVFAEFSMSWRQFVEGGCNLNMILAKVLHVDIDGASADVLALS